MMMFIGLTLHPGFCCLFFTLLILLALSLSLFLSLYLSLSLSLSPSISLSLPLFLSLSLSLSSSFSPLNHSHLFFLSICHHTVAEGLLMQSTFGQRVKWKLFSLLMRYVRYDISIYSCWQILVVICITFL